MQTEKQNAKIIKIIKKIDEMMIKNGYLQYQERFHRIYKTLLSIQRHTECFVSPFTCNISTEPSQLQEEDLVPETIDSCISNSAYISFNGDNEIQVENEEEKVPYKLELDKLLLFIENELNIQNLINDTTAFSSSDEEEEREEAQGEEEIKVIKPQVDTNELTKENMGKKFFKIELKLRTYIEEQEYFKKNFDSILNSAKRSATPMSKFKNQTPLPVIIKNFFQDKESIKTELENAKKRFSLHEDRLKSDLAALNIYESFKKQSMSEEPMLKAVKANNEVSNFNTNVENPGNTTGNDGMMFNFFKRNSIFNEKNNLGVVQEDEISGEEEEDSVDSCVSDIEECEEEDNN